MGSVASLIFCNVPLPLWMRPLNPAPYNLGLLLVMFVMNYILVQSIMGGGIENSITGILAKTTIAMIGTYLSVLLMYYIATKVLCV